jgi:hypothetical protein
VWRRSAHLSDGEACREDGAPKGCGAYSQYGGLSAPVEMTTFVLKGVKGPGKGIQCGSGFVFGDLGGLELVEDLVVGGGEGGAG